MPDGSVNPPGLAQSSFSCWSPPTWRSQPNAVYCPSEGTPYPTQTSPRGTRALTTSVTMRKTKNPFSLSAPTKPDRLAEIYRAAAQIICEKGYDATSMNDIAEAVGITKAGLYHHIPGKKDLLFRIMNFGLDALEEEVIIPTRAIADAEQRLRAIISNHVRLITKRSSPQGHN